MKSDEEIMQILEAFDLTQSFRDAGELAGCSPNTVPRRVAERDGGTLERPARRDQLIDPYRPKVEEWVTPASGNTDRASGWMLPRPFGAAATASTRPSHRRALVNID